MLQTTPFDPICLSWFNAGRKIGKYRPRNLIDGVMVSVIASSAVQMYIVGLSTDWVKQKTIKLVYVASLH